MSSAVQGRPESTDANLDDYPSSDAIDARRARTPNRRISRTRVLIASAQPLVRHALRTLLTAEAEFDVVGEAGDGGSAVKLARQVRPDVVVIDLVMPRVDGITATRLIRSEAASAQVVVMAGTDDDGPAVEALRAGATAYLPRETRTEVVVQTIRDASVGHVAMPSQAVARLIRGVGRRNALSEREAAVLRRVAQGKMNKQIAQELAIAESTVKSHVGSLLTKLRLGSRTQLALYAARTGLAVMEDEVALG